MVDPRRVQVCGSQAICSGPVIYWMSRDQRVQDNWALLYAQQQAILLQQPLLIVFCLAPTFLEATLRQYNFMLQGLAEVEQTLQKYALPFFVLSGNPAQEIVRFARKYRAGLVVADFDPLRMKRQWKQEALAHLPCALHEVDAHNIVPCWEASWKQEFGAYTIRPKIRRMLDDFLNEFPKVQKQKNPLQESAVSVNWSKIQAQLHVDSSVSPSTWFIPGQKEALKHVRQFIEKKIVHYSRDRNDPNADGQSHLSPYLHFGHISAQRIALELKKMPGVGVDAFLEELIIRRELADNFCYYNAHYDSFEGFPTWAKTSLLLHAKDEREYVYTRSEFECAKTHDPLWNAAQLEMVCHGKMHGYMRMYWAKKILEWSRTIEEALATAIYLNDRYELDGRDPNGYAGIAWAMGGVHDRAWFDRPVFGKIRYMNSKGCASKFDVNKYIHKQNEELLSTIRSQTSTQKRHFDSQS